MNPHASKTHSADFMLRLCHAASITIPCTMRVVVFIPDVGLTSRKHNAILQARSMPACQPLFVVTQAEVRHHEPHEALDGGGQDGLPAVESLCRAALRLLKPGGFLAIETGGECRDYTFTACFRFKFAQGSGGKVSDVQ